MSRTANLGLPLVLPAQAQKHVTVNEAFTRLDALTQLAVMSSTIADPPAGADGESYIVPAGATGDWAGKATKLATWNNGGWQYIEPRTGWVAWDESQRRRQVFDGSEWVADAVAISAHGAATIWRVLEFDHAVTPGATNSTSVSIPALAQVVGVTASVIAALSGNGLTGWRVGVAGASDRYGSGLGIAATSYALGLSGAPVTYYTATPLLLTAEGGSFASGAIRLAVHLVQLQPPRAV